MKNHMNALEKDVRVFVKWIKGFYKIYLVSVKKLNLYRK